MSYILLFFSAMAAQWLWSSQFAFWGLAPQLLLVLTALVAAYRGPILAMCLGFFWGLFLDVSSPHLFGANALALTMVGYGTGSVRRQIDVTGAGSLSAVVFLMTWAYFLLLGVLGLVFMEGFLWIGWPSFLACPFYNVILVWVVAVAPPFIFLGKSRN
ncbi:MAG: rod shape-determining protein MreD [Elusimicrobia bacterium]|nr:rod shape-determining protein MreD [Elusimicrobiota bacterium]